MNMRIPGVETPVGPSVAQVGDGPTGRRVSQKRVWRRFVEARRTELHDVYPCAAPTARRLCPKHGTRVGPVTRICKPCRDELYEQLAGEYPKGDTTMTTDAETIETTGALELYEPPATSITLFGTSDPGLALTRMATIARLLVDVVRERELVTKIAGNDYLLAPAWAVLAGMTGLAPYTAWTRKLDDGTGYLARVEVRRVADGTTIAAAEQLCNRSEPKWARAKDHELLGMAQTRATTRALRGPLMQVVELAGYQVGLAEEMPTDVAPEPAEPARSKIPVEIQPTRDQLERVGDLLAELGEREPDVDWRLEARDLAGVPAEMLTATITNRLIGALERRLEQLAGTATA
jgi:hypothetical protein